MLKSGLISPGGPVVKHLPAYTTQRSLPILFGILRHVAGCTCPKGRSVREQKLHGGGCPGLEASDPHYSHS